MKQAERIAGIAAPVLTAVAILLLAFSFLSAPAPAEPVIDGGAIEAATNFDDLALSGDLDVGDDVTFWAGDVYPLGSETNDLALFAGEATVTGTLVITESTHGLTSIVAEYCNMSSAGGVTAGDPATCYTVRSGATVTITVLQDDFSNAATSPATIDYLIIGAPD